MDWKAGLDAALLAFLQTQVPDAVSLVSWEDTAGMGGYCDTCAYPEVTVEFVYLRADGSRAHYDHDGSFSDLIQRLTAPVVTGV